MSLAQSARDTFLKMVRQQLQLPNLSFEDAMKQPLAQTLLDMISSTLETSSPAASPAPSPAAPPPLASFTQSRAVLGAAIRDTFDLQELEPNDAERAALITVSGIVVVAGQRRLRLTDAARAEVIAAARSTDLYQKLLRETVNVDQDPKQFDSVTVDPVRRPSAWLRAFLINEFGNLDTFPPQELAAALAARERLRLVTGLAASVPSISDLQRRVALAELLEPLQLLIGAEGGWNGSARRDRFVGRKDEIIKLRGFVDELSSKSIGEALSRLVGIAANALGVADKPNMRVVQADGGLGKSALLAKFVLDHALDQKRRFPFAYLDFDRAALDPEQPAQLLIEIARQVGLQFSNAQPECAALAQEIRQDRVQTSSGTAATATTAIRDPYANFVEILRKHATFSDRAFLLVLDTVEVVQWNPSGISKLAGMLQEFRNKGLVELRVVASGRADIPELRRAAGVSTPDDNIKLGALSPDEAADMAQRLGQAAIGSDWNLAWSKAIAGEVPSAGLFETVKRALTPRSDVRREPLTVRVAVDLILQADSSDRAKIVSEMQAMKEDQQSSLAARLYERRIVNHVRDPKARKLAWPGLVLRRVTPDIARELLAPRCGLAPEDVDAAFESLAKEVWMVVREGNALKHRPDLRARTLPLMRANDQKTFDCIAQAAVEYFGQYRDRSREDRAEWVYHRLLAGEKIQTVIADITPELLRLLAGAEDDFAPDSEAASYLVSRTRASRLSPAHIRRLSVNDALYHLSVTSQTVFGLDDMSVDQIALEVAQKLDLSANTIGNELYPWARALWIKTGAWGRNTPGIPSGENLSRMLWRANVYWAARLAPSLAEEQSADMLLRCVQGVNSGLRPEEHPGLRSTIQVMAMARVCRSPFFEVLDKQVARILTESKPNPMASLQAALRTGIVLGNECRGPALNLWLMARRRGATVRVQDPTFSAAEVRALARPQSDAVWLLQEIAEANTNTPLRIADERAVTSVAQLMDQLLTGLIDAGGESDLGRRVARVFACRDEDWIVPFGYAAERATRGKYSDALRYRLAAYTSADSASLSVSGPPAWNDMVGAMRIADEAGDLAGFARYVLELSNPDSVDTEDLRDLLPYRDAWANAIAGLLRDHHAVPLLEEEQPESPSDKPPAAGPIVHKEDVQKGRWGGASQRDGRSVHAVLESVERDVFYFSLVVESVDGSPLMPPVVFHLHDTFPRRVIHIRRIADRTRAEFSDVSAYGTFTVGVQVKTGSGQWTSLELDLSTLAGLPTRFLDR
jgi:hypothetical protein